MNDFSKRLRNLRVVKGLSQEELGKVLGYQRSAISGYEVGRNQPSYEVLNKISEYFNVSIDYLLGSDDKKDPDFIDLLGVNALTDEEYKQIIDFLKQPGYKRYLAVSKEAAQAGITPESLKTIVESLKMAIKKGSDSDKKE